MLPDNHACNARNIYPGTVYFEKEDLGRPSEDIYCEDIEIDYKSDDLTYETILNLIRGRYSPHFPREKRLLTTPNQRLFIFMNGHGGENFFKIQDTEVVHSEDFAKVFDELHLKQLYSEVLLILDSCEALSLFDQVEAPNILMVGTSIHGQHALSNQLDGGLNVYLNDRFSYHFVKFLESKQFTRGTKISEFPSLFTNAKLLSDLAMKSTLSGNKTAADILLADYIPIDKQDVIKEDVKVYDYD